MSTRGHLQSVHHDLRHLVTQGAAVRPMSTEHQEELWRRIESRAQARRRPPLLVISAGMAIVALSLLGFWMSRPDGLQVAEHERRTALPSPAQPEGLALALPPQARSLRLGNRVALGLWPDAQVTLPATAEPNDRGEYRLRLDSGRIVAAVAPRAADEPLSVVTPQLSVTVVGTRFSVQVDENVTSVAVEQGRVRVERQQQVVYLSAGDSIRSDDARLCNRQPVVPCASEPSVAARRLCLLREAHGEGLAAQNGLYALALLERDQGHGRSRALTLLREHQRRFPHGPLAPEVARAIAALLAAEP